VKAIVIERPGEFSLVDAPDPRPGPGEVLVRVRACGVCGTDLHIADGEFAPTPYPIIPGHEFSGEVAELGAEGGAGLAVGDRVAVDPSLFCGHCHFCRAGRGNLCENWGAIGDTVDGAFAQYVSVPARNAYRLPDHVGFSAGALIEPTSCAVHGMRRLGPVAGEDVLIVGAGTMGLLLLQLLERAGAARVAVVDRSASRCAVAAALGASETASSVEALDRSFGVAVDATGVPAAIEAAFGAVRRGGRLLVFGVAPAEASVALSPFRIYNDEITVIGSMAVLFSFDAAVELVATGTIDTAALLSAPLPLAEYGAALERVRRGEGIKTQLTP
jgi:2-desacetyl-2-hydroxyethyl bacteriochlorophyllide A dehydrogenase